MRTINGPTYQSASNQLIYQVTLSSGMIITNPSGFGATEPLLTYQPAIVSESRPNSLEILTKDPCRNHNSWTTLVQIKS